MTRSVALAGFAPATRNQVYQSKADEVWSLNMIHSSKGMRGIFPLNIHRLFELHPKWMLQTAWYSTSDHWAWLTKIKHHYPVYLIEDYPEIHNGVVYPLEAISERYLSHYKRGGDKFKYFTSSLCYMIAMALYEEFDVIEIYGFEMGSGTEYIYQKAAAEFWLGIAGQHADVVLPENSRLLRSGLYGFEGGQLVHPDVITEYRTYYQDLMDWALLAPTTTEKWVQGNLCAGALTLLNEIAHEGDSTSRQVLENYRIKFGKASAKFNHEINTLNAQSWERDDGGKEPLFQRAFERYKNLLRSDGAYQLACKLIDEIDLQETNKELVNRYRFKQFSETDAEKVSA